MQGYSEEEKRLWEDLKYGMILGTAECVKKLRDTVLPGSVDKEIPRQLKIQKDIDSSDLIRKAAAMCDVDMLFWVNNQKSFQNQLRRTGTCLYSAYGKPGC